MALSTPAAGNIVDSCLTEWLREEEESSETSKKFWECSAAVERGEMTVDTVWSDKGDLSFVFKPAGVKS